MRKLAKQNILKVQPYIPGKPVEEVKRELGLKDIVKLASNENAYGPSPKVLKAIERKSKDLNRYPEGDCFYLRKELSKKLGVSPNQLIFGNGSDEIIVLVVRAFVGEKDEVVMARPSFLVYEIASKIAGAKIKSIALKNFRYDLEGMKKAVTKRTKIVFIGNPDNPSGTYVTTKEVRSFLKDLSDDLLIFFDEAYFEYVRANDYPNTIALLKESPNIIITRTFSKMYALAGLRIGYGIASSEIVDILNRVREPFNVNSLAQVAALASLKDRLYYKRIAKIINAQKRFLYCNFRKMGLSFVETATNFILVDVQQNSSKVFQELLRKGVIVRDMSFWGLKSFIRVSIGTEKENRKLISALKEVL